MGTVLYFSTGKGAVTVRGEDAEGWRIEAHGLKNWEVNELAVLPSDPQRVFAGTRGDGVWRSEDMGKTWKKPSYGRPGPGKVRCVTIDEKDPNTIYAGTEPIGIWVTHDGCQNWEELTSVWDVKEVASVTYPVATVEPHVRDITLDPHDSSIIYAALQVGSMLKSVDGGRTWTLISKNVDADIHTIVSRPDNPKRVYVATGGHDNRLGTAPGRALYYSEDAGDTWSPIAMEFQQEYSVPLVLSPRNPDVLFSAVAKGQPPQWRRETGAEALLIRSKDGGASWHQLQPGFEAISQNFPEAIAIDDADDNHMFVATRKGEIFVSNDGGDSWSEIGVQVPEVADMKLVHA